MAGVPLVGAGAVVAARQGSIVDWVAGLRPQVAHSAYQGPLDRLLVHDTPFF